MFQSLPHIVVLFISYVYSLDEQATTLGLQKWVSVCLRGPRPSRNMVASELCLKCYTVLLGCFFGFFLEVAGSSCSCVRVKVVVF